jgi:hypothetical protein
VSDFLDSGWYDKGGVLPPGLSEIRNDTGNPIVVLMATQVRAGVEYIKRTYGGAGTEGDDK